MTDTQLKVVFFDVLNGFSKFNSKEYGEIYIKHSDNFSSLELNREYDFLLNKALNSGLPAEKDKLKQLEEEKLWTAKEDREIYDLEFYIKNLYKTKSQLHLSRDIEQIKKQIKEEEDKINKLRTKKYELLELTAERYANQKINTIHIFNSLYRTADCKKKFFTKEEYDDLEDKTLNELAMIYRSATENINEKSLKKISVSHFFTNYFYLSSNPEDFYGVPIKLLTYYQVELYSYARYYKNLISNSQVQIPDEIMSEPEKLTDWFDKTKNLEKLESKTDSGTSMLVGATAADLKELGYDKSEGKDIVKEMMKTGGNLSYEEIIKLHQ